MGSGIIAIEYAKIFRKLGCSVTMLVRGTAMSALDRLGLDETIAQRLLQGLYDDDVKLMENTQADDPPPFHSHSTPRPFPPPSMFHTTPHFFILKA